MASSTTHLDLIAQSQSSKEVTANALFDAGSPATLFGRRASLCSGLNWFYYGGVMMVDGVLTAISQQRGGVGAFAERDELHRGHARGRGVEEYRGLHRRIDSALHRRHRGVIGDELHRSAGLGGASVLARQGECRGGGRRNADGGRGAMLGT
ncbi:MAG: hypothetical protein V5B40_15655 [Candidatus Accumulibacter meliphilus]|jgi:hypothetical protein|uniref:hypothetical protein n=1 Tax=Candidatus Accumulibacter meliphilus TaxID=2211374 RepID=UPI002FC2AB58